MAFSAVVVRVMIASPSDVNEERQIAVDVINEWNVIHSASRGIVLMPVRWETHASSQLGRPAQDDINEYLTDLADLMVGIFWTKVGTPTGEHEGGAVEEISRHSAAGRPTMLYFSERSISFNTDLGQIESVKQLRERYQSNGTVWSYDSADKFRQLFTRDLAIHLERSRFGIDVIVPRPTEEQIEVTLSSDAAELLDATVKDEQGYLMVMRIQNDFVIQANRHQFTEGSPRSSARWLAAQQELIQRRFIADLTGKGQTYRVTNAGYAYADAHHSEEIATDIRVVWP